MWKHVLNKGNANIFCPMMWLQNNITLTYGVLNISVMSTILSIVILHLIRFKPRGWTDTLLAKA